MAGPEEEAEAVKAKIEKTTRDWRAVRRGDVFCAPRCGRACTWKEHVSAKLLAEATARALGHDWTPIVWENLGWHARAVSPCGRVKVHAYTRARRTFYLAFLGEPNSDGGRWAAHGTTPIEVVRSVFAKARADLRAIRARIESIEEAVENMAEDVR